jgi:hypothetical protein
MANRYFKNQYVYSMEKDVKQLFAHVTFGASGAPVLDTKNSKGFQSITRVSAGLYNIVFGTPASSQAATTDKYFKLLMPDYAFANATSPAAPIMYVVSNTVSSNGTLQVQFNVGGTSTDPAVGEQLYLQFIMGDSNT